MARTFTPKAKKHVTYVTPTGKLLSATITSVVSGDLLALRIGRSQTLAGVPKQTGESETGVWRVAGAHVGANVGRGVFSGPVLFQTTLTLPSTAALADVPGGTFPDFVYQGRRVQAFGTFPFQVPTAVDLLLTFAVVDVTTAKILWRDSSRSPSTVNSDGARFFSPP